MRHEKESKVWELFFESPGKKFTVREIELQTKIPRASVQRYLNKMKKNKLITEGNESVNNLMFKTMKISYFMEKIVESGLVNELVEKMNPSCVVLFGSVRKGDSDGESDVDIFVEGHVKEVPSLKKFEKKLKHPIEIFVKKSVHDLQEHLFNNVVNGINLYGQLKIK